MIRRLGFLLLLAGLVLCVFTARRGLLWDPREPPRVTSISDYKKDDGSKVHSTMVVVDSGKIRWEVAAPIFLTFVAGVICISLKNAR
jgi:hypothetical protein